MINKALITIILIQIALIFSGCSYEKATHAKSENGTPEVRKGQNSADSEIEKAKQLVEKMPGMAKAHVTLASAYLKKVRETGDYSINREAEKSLVKALEIEPENTDAMLLQTQIYLSEHKFQEVLELAQKISEKIPNDSGVQAAIVDAQTELGLYEDAVKSAQKLVDLKPNSSAYTRVAHLRALYGDVNGGIEARQLAIRIADPGDNEHYAWLHSELGRDLFAAGRIDEAEKAFDRSLEIFPEYHWAMAGKGQVLASKGNYEPALNLFKTLYERTFQAGRAIYLGDLYMKMGRNSEGQKIYEETVARERGLGDQADMHRIAQFWADHDTNLDEALEIARKDREVNKDLLASDTLAWCLYKKGKFAEAKKYMAEAMRLKSKNAQFYYHAGMIENAMGNKAEAMRLLKLALDTNPSFDLLQADIARETLKSLN